MQVSHSFWDAFEQYFTGNTLLPLFAIAVLYLMRNWKKEKKIMALAVFCLSVLLLYNEAAYRLTEAVGEGSSYYRFFWICPMALICVYPVVELLYHVKGKRRFALAGVLCLMVWMFSSKDADRWVNFPENIYQLDTDVIQVADALMELSGGEPVTLLDNGGISSTIRQYNAKVKFTEVNTYYINHILYTENTNYIGKYIQDYVYINGSEYLSIEKAVPARWKVIETGGLKRVAETDGYYLYEADHSLFDADAQLIEELEVGLCDNINIEYIPISGLDETFEFLYLSDFGDWANDAVYEEVIAQAASTEADAIFINTGQSENAEWVTAYEDLLEECEIPYYCNNQPIQMIDCGAFAVCMIDNRQEIKEETCLALEEAKNLGKPVVAILSSQLSDGEQTELFTALTEENSPVVEVLSVKEDDFYKELLNDRVLQYATPTGEKAIFNIVRVTGLEKEQ